MASPQTQKNLPETITVDGKHYNLTDLNNLAKAQLPNLRFADEQIQLLNNRKALTETARSAYAKVLAENLPEKKAPGNRKKDVLTIDGERYRLEDFSDLARGQLLSIQFADREMERLNNELAVAQTARTRYATVLADELKGVKPLKTQ